MADNETKLIISIESVLKNLDRTLAGLGRVEKQLKSIATIKVGAQANSAAIDKATVAATKLNLQQQRLATQSVELANRQERARQTTERLAQSQARLATSAAKATETQKKAALAALPQADAHVRAFRGIEKANKDAERSASALNARLQSLGNGLRSLGQGAASIGIGLSAALTLPLVALGKAGLDAAVTIDSLKRGLIAIVGSSEEAEVQLKRLTEIAKLPGIGFEEAIQGSIRLQAVGFSAKEAEKALIEFSNAIALTGGGREELSRVTVQLGQLAAKGKVLSQDLRPIIEAAPAVGRALKAAFGTVNADDIAAMTTNSREFLDVLTRELEKLPRAAGGAKNAFENFRDEIFRASAAVGDALIPVLTKLIQFAGPTITALANGFRALPEPLQVAAVAAGVLTAALGPMLFLFGQLTTGIGRTAVAFAQLSALGYLPTIANMRVFIATAPAVIANMLGIQAATVAAAAPWVALAVVVGAALIALKVYNSNVERFATITDDQLTATKKQIDGYDEQLKFLGSLTKGVAKTADEQERLKEIYAALNPIAQTRISAIDDETRRTQLLTEELQRLAEADRERLRLQGLTVAAKFAQDLQVLIDQRKEELEIRKALNAIDAGAAAPRRSGDIRSEAQVTTELVQRLGELNDETKKQETLVRQGASTLRVYEKVSGVSAQTTLEFANKLGVLDTSLDDASRGLVEFTGNQQKANEEVDALTKAVDNQIGALLQLGKLAEDSERRRKTIISSAAASAREVSDSFEGATKWMKAFIAANPELGEAVKKELQLQGKSIDEFLDDTLGRRDKRGGALRNAQEQLAKAVAEASKANAEQENSIEHDKNERLLQENEHAFKLQLIAYRQYLMQRAFLTNSNIELEIREQEKIATNALAQQQRFAERAQRRGIPAPERVKAQAGVVEAEKAVIEANTKILALRAKQKAATQEVNDLLAESQREQIKDVRQLEIEYATLRGKIEDALNAATDEKFAETLKALALAQDDLNKRLETAKELKDADAIDELERQRNINQRQIDAIQGIIEQERATNRLAATQEFISQAKQRQSDLEKQIAFDVEFRGLKEQDAIRARLAGEEKVKNSLAIARDIIQETIDRLNQLGLTPPKGLIDFVKEVQLAMKGLGELSFAEQFRLAEQEFNRLNDERITKIADVERAVRHRDLAEIEGRILIKKLNGEYVADLERQAELLRQIADRSGNQGLQKQATDAQQTAKDIHDATTEVADFNVALRSTSIDALREGFSQFFRDLTDNTKTAKEKLLSLLDSVRNRINDFIAERLADKLIESLFGTGKKGDEGLLGGIFNKVLGIHAPQDQGVVANTTATEDNTAAINALTSTFGGQPAAGGGTGGVISLVGSLFGGGGDKGGGGTEGKVSGVMDQVGGLLGQLGINVPGLSGSTAQAGSTVIESLNIVADWLAKTVDALMQNTQALQSQSGSGGGLQGLASLFGGGGGEATGDIIPAAPKGRIIRVAEAGFDEAVLTTDPKHVVRQAAILREFLKRTHGLMGRFKAAPDFAEGGLISARDAEANMLASIASGRVGSPRISESALASVGAQSQTNLRILNLLDKRQLVGGHLRSAEGAMDIMNIISENRDEVGRRIGVR